MVPYLFRLAAVCPGRQQGFRHAVVAHLVLLAAGVAWAYRYPQQGTSAIGYFLLTAGIVEGAVLLGWRLTQLPKSQALEFLFVSPLRPWRLFVVETVIGLCRITLITLSGLPVLLVLSVAGILDASDVGPFLFMPLTWAAVTGLGFIAWAYEPRAVRCWAERGFLLLILIYLGVGVLAGEHLAAWIRHLPEPLGQGVLLGFESFDRYNPFAVLRFWLEERSLAAWERVLGVEAAALIAAGLLLVRTAGRLRGHFDERHYQPAVDHRGRPRPSPGDRPLSWWAVRRVSEYSGRVNFWLAGGFGLLYAIYTVAGAHWPAWAGRRVLAVFDVAGGVPVWATALVVLSAVPAAFQYGLWDSNPHERCRRLELLLLTQLTGIDYWHAAAAAAWKRGRGYFGVALLLWLAAAVVGKISFLQAVTAIAAGTVLWGLYFTLGFQAFTRGAQANLRGLSLTLGLPALAFVFHQIGWPFLAGFLPPGAVHHAATLSPDAAWIGAVGSALVALWMARICLGRCDGELHRWYEKHHGKMVLE
ncbi:MAG TPA: hypothetical protein VKU02_24110 [Gemmataceae bacterium]|nr:hypothetical protein [Gemmataceae bacterium]